MLLTQYSFLAAGAFIPSVCTLFKELVFSTGHEVSTLLSLGLDQLDGSVLRYPGVSRLVLLVALELGEVLAVEEALPFAGFLALEG